MLKVTLNSQQPSLIVDGHLLNDQVHDADISVIDAHTWHIIRNNKSFRAEVVEADYATKTFKIKVNGHLHVAEVKDKFDLLLESMGLNAAASTKVNDVKAPMPGLILDIKVSEGQAVQKGDALIILEAMKMENVIKAAGDGIVKAIKANKGDKVEKNQLLIQF
jgi:biotin carboxyl carrier protein